MSRLKYCLEDSQIEAGIRWYMYSKTCVKRPISKRQQIRFQDQCRSKVLQNAPRGDSAMLSTFIIPAYLNYQCFQNTSVSQYQSYTKPICLNNHCFHETITFTIPLISHYHCVSQTRFFTIPLFS